MTEVIGDILPVAVGVAISPLPIVAVILMLLAPKAKASSMAFAVGWLLGIAVVVTVVTLIAGPSVGSDSGPSLIGSILKILLGVAALVLAFRQWQSRPKEGQDPVLPKWMAAIDTMTPGKAFGLGAALSGVNPKNLTLCLTAGVTIGAAGLSIGNSAIAIVVFVIIGGCSVAVPVIAFLVAGQKLQPALDRTRQWLTQHNAAVMTVVLLILGVTVIGKGIGGL